MGLCAGRHDSKARVWGCVQAVMTAGHAYGVALLITDCY